MAAIERVAVITGAASGMGLAIARRLAADGHRVALLDLHAEAALRAAEELRQTGARAIAAEVDVTDRGAVDAALGKVRAELGPVAMMVTAAGVDAFERFDQITLESWERVVGVNLTGTFHSIQAAVPDMLEARWGRMVTISSSSAQTGSPHMAHYVASKAGVIGLTKALAREVSGQGVRVNAVAPGWTESPMTRGLLEPDDVRRITRTMPLRKVATPGDVATQVVVLASERLSGHVTGELVTVAGGMEGRVLHAD